MCMYFWHGNSILDSFSSSSDATIISNPERKFWPTLALFFCGVENLKIPKNGLFGDNLCLVYTCATSNF